MSGLFSAFSTAANTLDVLQQAMSVVQNNVANASTPGYVTQTLNITSMPFLGAQGGIQAGNIVSSRSTYAEQSVQYQNSLLGQAAQQASSLSSLQSIFDITGKSGIPAALSSLYSAFSAWSNSPSDATSQQGVLNAAQTVAQAFNSAAANVGQIQSQSDQQVANTVAQINQLSSQIAGINQQIRYDGKNDPGLQANLYSDLESLSNLTSIGVQIENDGTATVSMGGQTPLVVGATVNQLASSATPNGVQITINNQDVTSSATGGQLGGLVGFLNNTIPSVIGNATQPGSLNQLAQAVANQVNSLLTGGQTISGNPGAPLFSLGSMYTVNGQQTYTPPAANETETLTFTTASGATATATIAAGDDLSTAISKINQQTASMGIYAVQNSNGTGISFQSSNNFSISDQQTGTGTAAGAVFGSANTTAASYVPQFSSATTYTVAGQQNYASPAVNQSETLTFTTASGATATATVAAADNLSTAIGNINAQTASIGIHAVLNANGTGISLESSSNFSINDRQTGTGTAAPAVFSTADTSPATYIPTAAPLPNNAAATLSVTNITASQLAAAQPSASGNGVASQLAQLGTTVNSALGESFTDFYSNIASNIGSQASNASTAQQTQTALLTQAQNMRSQVEGVSLNEQAAQLMQFQQAYEASSQFIQVISSMNQYFMQAMQQI